MKTETLNNNGNPPDDKANVSRSYDSEKCDKCGGRTALVTGQFYYEPEAEPYMNGKTEACLVKSGDCWVGGFICDSCGNVQGLWHE